MLGLSPFDPIKTSQSCKITKVRRIKVGRNEDPNRLWASGLKSLQGPAAAAAKSLQSCPTLRDPIEGSPPGSSVPGILQARTLKWVAISFSNACMHAKSLQSRLTLCDPMDSSPPGSSVHRILQVRILEWVAISFFLPQGPELPSIEFTHLKLLNRSPGHLSTGKKAVIIALLNEVEETSGLFKLQSNFQFSSVAQSCPTLWDPMDCSTPGLPVHHQLPEPTQTCVHPVGEAIQPSHPLSSPSLPAFNLPQHQFSYSVVSDPLQPHEPQHAMPPSPSPTARVYPNPCPLSQ